MVFIQHLILCIMLWLDVLVIISYNGVLTLPIALKPTRPPYPSPIFLDDYKLQKDRTQLWRTGYSIQAQDTEMGTPDGTGRTDAQHDVRAKSNTVDLTKSYNNKQYVSNLLNKPLWIASTDTLSGKTINTQPSTLFNVKKDSRIPKVGGLKTTVAQVVVDKLLGDLSNQSKLSILNSSGKANDLPTVHSSKRRAVNNWRQDTKTVQLAVYNEVTNEGQGSMEVHETLTAVMALVILCSLGMVGGVFGCCCQKKKLSPEPDDETKDTNVANDNGVKENIPLVNTSEILTADVDLDDGTSVKEKAKALDSILLLQPSPSHRRSQLSPDSPSKRLSRSLDRADDRKSKSLDVMMDSEMSKSIADSITDTQDDITDNLSMYSSTISQPINPDVVIADSDEEDQFAEIQRGTKILKSFQRAKPPRNRSPATRTPKGKIRKHRQTQPDERKSEPVQDQEPVSQSSNVQLGTSSSKTSSLERSEPEHGKSASKTNSLDKSTGSLDVLDATSESPLLKSSDFSDLDSDMATSITSIGSDIVTPTKRKGRCAKHKDRKIITADVVMNKNRDINDERSEVSKRYEPKVESPLAKRKNGKKSNGVEANQKRSSKVVNDDNDQNTSTNVKRLSGVPAKASNNIFYLIDPTVKDKCKSVGDVTKSEGKNTDDSDAKKQKLESSEGNETSESLSPVKRERTFSDPRK